MEMSKRNMIGMEMLTASLKSESFYEINMSNNIQGLVSDAIYLTDIVMDALFNPSKGFTIKNLDNNEINIPNEARSIYSLWISEGRYKDAKDDLITTYKVSDNAACMFLNQYCN